jgi:hypothetical protein
VRTERDAQGIYFYALRNKYEANMFVPALISVAPAMLQLLVNSRLSNLYVFISC